MIPLERHNAQTVPMVDLKAQCARIRPEVDAAVERVIASTQFIKGEDCRLLEQEFAACCGASHACGVANGTDALILALRAYGVGPGDEVVTVANTFIATGEAILLNGARPVFVDVDPATFTMDPGLVEKAITPRTKVILPVHLYGHPADMGAIIEIAGTPRPARARGRRPGPRGRRIGAGARAAWATRPASASTPARTWGPTATPAWSPRRTRDFLARVRQIANHGGGDEQVRQRGAGHQQPARHAAGRRSCASSCATSTRWNDERRERVRAYYEALGGLPGRGRCRGSARARARPGTCTRSA